MKIKRFVADDMRSALRKVTDTRGPDAVILSNNRIDEGVEIVAAIDYDESLINEPVAAPVIKKPNPFISDDEALSRTHIEQRNREAALDDVRYARNIPAATTHQYEKYENVKQARVEPKFPKNEHLWTEEPAFMKLFD